MFMHTAERFASRGKLLKIFAFRLQRVLFPPLKMLQPDVLFETECNQPDVYVV
jgi:hypothetical protein